MPSEMLSAKATGLLDLDPDLISIAGSGIGLGSGISNVAGNVGYELDGRLSFENQTESQQTVSIQNPMQAKITDTLIAVVLVVVIAVVVTRRFALHCRSYFPRLNRTGGFLFQLRHRA